MKEVFVHKINASISYSFNPLWILSIFPSFVSPSPDVGRGDSQTASSRSREETEHEAEESEELEREHKQKLCQSLNHHHHLESPQHRLLPLWLPLLRRRDHCRRQLWRGVFRFLFLAVAAVALLWWRIIWLQNGQLPIFAK